MKLEYKRQLILWLILAVFISFVFYVKDSKAQCTGASFFAGYGFNYGPNYNIIESDGRVIDTGKFRDRNQGVFGIDHNWDNFRFQIYHSSSIENGFNNSVDDTWMANFLFKYDF